MDRAACPKAQGQEWGSKSNLSVARQGTDMRWSGGSWQGRAYLEREPEFVSSSLWALLSLGPWKLLASLKTGEKGNWVFVSERSHQLLDRERTGGMQTVRGRHRSPERVIITRVVGTERSRGI